MTTVNDLCADIGWQSINHAGETLCGDHVEIVEQAADHAAVIVLADGLGSGVKANILSTLTSKIIATMLAAGMKLEEIVETVIATLPVCSVRNIAYSTFTIIRIVNQEKAEIIQYDSPKVVLLRDGANQELDFTTMHIAGKEIVRAETKLQENDVFLAFTDGVEHAGVGLSYNFGWKRSDMIAYMATLWHVGFTAKTLTTILLEETNRLYAGQPGDDATVCTVRIRKREPVNLMIGPPANPADCNKMLALFFGKAGKHIVCGGTTSALAATYLGKPLRPNLHYSDPEIPPTAFLEGAELVTEGIVTINRVLDYAKDYLAENRHYETWCSQKDGASQIARMLFEDATDINFYVGRAVNPAHQNTDLPIHFTLKMQLVRELADCLEQMGKHIKVSYF